MAVKEPKCGWRWVVVRADGTAKAVFGWKWQAKQSREGLERVVYERDYEIARDIRGG